MVSSNSSPVGKKVKLTDNTEDVGVTPEGYLDVKTHSSAKCYTKDYTDAQAGITFITPTSGKKIIVRQVYVSTETTTTNVTLGFLTSSKTVFKLYTTTRAAATGNIICGEGAIDEVLSLTCGAKTFISVAYDEE